MKIVCLDLEGVLVPEIWIGVAERTGIEELRLTTRDISDYDVLMTRRIEILDAAPVDHATFGIEASRQLMRRLASREDVDSLVKGRLALENPASFSIVAENSMCIFVCTSVGFDVHELEACVWPQGARRLYELRELRAWHRQHFPEHLLTPSGNLLRCDREQWDRLP